MAKTTNTRSKAFYNSKPELYNSNTTPPRSLTSFSGSVFWLPLVLSPHLCMRHRRVKQLSVERLNKQAGPGTKSPPLTDMWQRNPLNPRPHPSLPHLPPGGNSEPLTLLPEPHRPLPHTPSSEPREGKDGGGGGANSDSYSPNVTTSQRGPHDTATKSELMDSFLSPANMTGGVCVRARGCGRGTGAGEGACLPH